MKKLLPLTFILISYTSFAYQVTDIVICDDDGDGLVCVDLTSKIPEILGSTSPVDAIITFHNTSVDADTNSNPIGSVTNFCTIQEDQTVYVRLENTLDGTNSILDFTIYGIVTRALPTTPLEGCDENGSGFGTFYLESKIDEITGGPYTNRIVTFHSTQADADAGTSPLNVVYTNITQFTQTIYARAARAGFMPENDCYQTTTLELITSSNPCNNPPPAPSAAYVVETIPYQLYDINATATGNLDDTFTNVIDIPFEFEFFDIPYNQFTIGTNGLISFDLTNANSVCNWNIDSVNMLPSSAFYENSILGVYHDLDNTEAGTLGYAVIGEAPFRKMVVFFDNINQFSLSCSDTSTTQIIIYETFNIVDVQVKQKIACASWNGGLAVLGIQNATGTDGFVPVNRNTGVWDAFDEGHRFRPEAEYENVFSVYCDDDSDGFLNFDLTAIENDVLGDISLGTITYFNAEQDAINDTSPLSVSFTNTSNAQKIYARIVNTTTNEVTIKTVTLSVISCTEDYDLDGVDTLDEDVNQDGNLGNDDTDGDGIPDFIDEDDDGDYVLTNLELVNTATGLPENSFLDTDNDMIPNHRDADDDGDGTLTIDEDYNGNNNPEDDDTNNNNIPDYLDTLVFLDVDEFAITDARVYPNPVKDKLIIETVANVRIKNIEIYSVDGRLVHAQNQAAPTNNLTVDVRDFASGFYLLRIKSQNNTVLTKRFIVE